MADVNITVGLDTKPAQTDAKKFTGELKKVRSELVNTDEAFRSGKEAAGIFGGRIGAAAEALDKARNSAFAAAGAIGPVGVAIAAVGVAAVGAVVGVIKLAEGYAALVTEAGEAIDRLEEIDGLGVDQADIETINRARDAMGALNIVGDEVAVTLGVDIAAAGEDAQRVILKLAFITRDFIQALEAQGETIRQIAGIFAPQLVAGYDAITSGINKLDIATANYDEEVEEYIGLAKRQREADEAAAGAAKKRAEETEFALERIKFKREEVNKDFVRGVEELVKKEEDAAAFQEDIARRTADTIASIDDWLANHRRQNIEKLKQAAVAFADNTIATFETVTATRLRNLQAEEGASKQSIMKAFRQQQAARLAGVGLEGIEQLARMTTFLIPALGPGAPLAAAGIVGPLTLANLAAVQSEPAPTFPTGRGPTMSSDPDHQMVGVQPTEAILTPRATEAVGGREGVEALNRGQAANQTIVIQIDGEVVARAMTRPGVAKAVARAIKPHLRGMF